jgi:serine/threonine-protein kinase RsbW
VASDPHVRLSIPGSLEYRDLAIRVVAAACKLVRGREAVDDDARADFDNHVVSAFGEAFNNAAIHAYRGRSPGALEIEIDVGPREITLRLVDHGAGFDPLAVAEPDLDSLPESGLGLFIMRSFMDAVSYQTGDGENPNVLSMTKRIPDAQEGAA